jgi:hypothetical protein
MSFHLSCKIRFEGPMRHLGREVKTSDAACKVNFNYNFAQYWTGKSIIKAISFVEKIDYMLQRRNVKDLGNQIDTKDPLYTKYAIIGFHFIAWMIIFVNVTI